MEAEARARRKGMKSMLFMGDSPVGEPPRPSVPPERLPAEASAQAGSGQFRSK